MTPSFRAQHSHLPWPLCRYRSYRQSGRWAGMPSQPQHHGAMTWLIPPCRQRGFQLGAVRWTTTCCRHPPLLAPALSQRRSAYDDPGKRPSARSTSCRSPSWPPSSASAEVLGALVASVLTAGWIVVVGVDLATGEVLVRCAFLLALGYCFGLVGDRLAQAASDRALISQQNLYIEGLTVHGLVRLDRSGSIARWNRARTEILVSEAEAQLGQPLALIFGGEAEAGSLPGRCSRAPREAACGTRRRGSSARAASAAGPPSASPRWPRAARLRDGPP